MAETDCIVLISGMEVWIDIASVDTFHDFNWRCVKRKKKWYVAASKTVQGKKSFFYLHRVVLGAKPGEICDHINGDPLDNRTKNLRFVTYAQNNMNREKYPSKSGNRFRGTTRTIDGYKSAIRIAGVKTVLGFYENDVEAAFVYDLASLEHHGEYGRRNFLPLAV